MIFVPLAIGVEFLAPERHLLIFVTELRRALGSDSEDEARVLTLYEWTRDSMPTPLKLTQPSKDLFREIGIAIAARRAAPRSYALLSISQDGCLMRGNTTFRRCWWKTANMVSMPCWKRQVILAAMHHLIPLLFAWRVFA